MRFTTTIILLALMLPGIASAQAHDKIIAGAVEALHKAGLDTPDTVVAIGTEALPLDRINGSPDDLAQLNGYTDGDVVHIHTGSALYGIGESLAGKHLLAAVIAHEMSHLDGADEAEARRVEAETIERFIELRMLPNHPAIREYVDNLGAK